MLHSKTDSGRSGKYAVRIITTITNFRYRLRGCVSIVHPSDHKIHCPIVLWKPALRIPLHWCIIMVMAICDSLRAPMVWAVRLWYWSLEERSIITSPIFRAMECALNPATACQCHTLALKRCIRRHRSVTSVGYTARANDTMKAAGEKLPTEYVRQSFG